MTVRIASLVLLALTAPGILRAEIRFSKIEYDLSAHAFGQSWDPDSPDGRRNVSDSKEIVGYLTALSSADRSISAQAGGSGVGYGGADVTTSLLSGAVPGYRIFTNASGGGADTSADIWYGSGGGNSKITAVFKVLGSTSITFQRTKVNYLAEATLEVLNASGVYEPYIYVIPYDVGDEIIYDYMPDTQYALPWTLGPGNYRVTLFGSGSGSGSDLRSSSYSDDVWVDFRDTQLVYVPEASTAIFATVVVFIGSFVALARRTMIGVRE